MPRSRRESRRRCAPSCADRSARAFVDALVVTATSLTLVVSALRLIPLPFDPALRRHLARATRLAAIGFLFALPAQA